MKITSFQSLICLLTMVVSGLGFGSTVFGADTSGTAKATRPSTVKPIPVGIAEPKATPVPLIVIEPEGKSVPLIVEPKVKAPPVVVAEANPWLVSAHFSYIDLMLPGKFGVAVGRGDSDNSMWELEWTHGSLTPFFIDDLGKFTEDRISLVQRSGSNNISGFQWFYGVFYHRFKLEIGNAMLNRLSTYYPSAELLSISGIGGVIGVGYRWLVSDHFLIGFDAITYSQPFYNLTSEQKFLEVVTDPNDRDKVEAGLTAMKYFPRVGIAKIAIGYTF